MLPPIIDGWLAGKRWSGSERNTRFNSFLLILFPFARSFVLRSASSASLESLSIRALSSPIYDLVSLLHLLVWIRLCFPLDSFGLIASRVPPVFHPSGLGI